MTTKEFLEKHNGAPYEFYEIAELLLSAITDNEDVSSTAKDFLEAKENLEMALDEIGFEPG